MNLIKGRRVTVIVIVVLLLLFSLGGVASGDSFNISLAPLHFIVNNADKTPSNGQFFNGQTYVPDGFIFQGTTYVPLRFLSTALGATVAWNGATDTITINSGGTGTSSAGNALEEVAIWNSPNLSTQGPWQTDPSSSSIYLKQQPTSNNTYTLTYNLNRVASEVKGTLYYDPSNSQMSTFGDYISYKVIGDNTTLYSVDNLMSGYVKPVDIDVSVAGYSTLTIQVQIGPATNTGFATTGIRNLRLETRQ